MQSNTSYRVMMSNNSMLLPVFESSKYSMEFRNLLTIAISDSGTAC